MKILIVASWFPHPDSPFAGVFIAEQARALATEHDVTVLVVEVLPSGSSKSRHLETRDGYKAVRVGLPARNVVHHLDYARAVVAEIRDSQCEIVHAHVSLPAGFAAVLAAGWTRHPVVITEHRGPFGAMMEAQRDRLKVRFALDRADEVIAVSRSLAREMAMYGIGRRIRVIPNLVDPVRFKPALSTRRVGEPFRLLFAGILRDHNKNLPLLLRSLARLSANGEGFHLTIAGDGEVRNECEELAIKLGISEHCRFRGAIQPDELAGEMVNCDLLVLPSRAETFGIVAAEAMTVGRPVVATRCGGPEDILTPETGILVPVDDEAALSGAIAHICHHLESFQPAQISAYAQSRFSHQVVVAQLVEIYHQVLHPRENARRAALAL